MAEPIDAEEFAWLRDNGIELVISLTEDPPRRKLINDAGLMQMHEPIEDMTAPSQEQLDKIANAIKGANDHDMGVAIHCTAGLGRTGVVLACYFVDQGMSAENALARVRRMRPGSIETDEQVEAVKDYASRHSSSD